VLHSNVSKVLHHGTNALNASKKKQKWKPGFKKKEKRKKEDSYYVVLDVINIYLEYLTIGYTFVFQFVNADNG